MFATIALLFSLVMPLQAQLPGDEPTPVEQAVAATGGASEEAQEEHGFDIMHHIMDATYWETPFGTIHLPEPGSWMVGPVDMTPTKHVLFMGFAASCPPARPSNFRAPAGGWCRRASPSRWRP